MNVLAQEIKSWANNELISNEEDIVKRIQFFPHTTNRGKLIVASVDSDGDYPTSKYLESYIYLTCSQSVVYKSDLIHGLKEVSSREPRINFSWIPEEEKLRRAAYEQTFEQLVGESISEIIHNSDYKALKLQKRNKTLSIQQLQKGLIFPQASDSSNIGIQLRQTAKLGEALKIMEDVENIDYLLIDSTFSLPLINSEQSLYFEHLKRYCCVKALENKICLLAISKAVTSSYLPVIEKAALASGKEGESTAEHWYIRLPTSPGEWKFSLIEDKSLPPAGAVTYLFRLHKTFPIMRLDLDRAYWDKYVKATSQDEILSNERKIFQDIDYLSHDQRSYGFPYPLKSCSDRTSLSQADKLTIRKQFIDVAVANGLSKKLFSF
ncbi:hypothetical protein [Spirosoma spitsbergense]|uniref:hypothetical protein n=1 Tax=Spirosoma spitsbergense TaxID=431554 RepID=UPI0012FCF291|nr:hypothetical protein [Spirosoma spitsbergense]